MNAELARTHGLIIQRNHLLEISMRCILVKLENVESLVSSAYLVITSKQYDKTVTTLGVGCAQLRE